MKYPNKEIVSSRICINRGQGSIKLAMKLFHPAKLEDQLRNQKDSGVNKVVLLAIVQQVEESSYNLAQIVQLLKLHEWKYFLASEPKLINIMLGLSAQNGKYASAYCIGAKET